MVKLVVWFKRRAGMEVETVSGSTGEPATRRWPAAFRGSGATCSPTPSSRVIARGSPSVMGSRRSGSTTRTRSGRFRGTDALRVRAQEDAAKFTDRSTMKTLVTDEHLTKDGELPGERVKNIEFVHRRPGLAVEEFQRYWREVHGPLASEIPMVVRYVQSHCRRGRLRERAPAPLRRDREHVVREHGLDARVGPHRRLCEDVRRLAQLHRAGSAPVRHHPGARHRRLTGPRPP